MGIIRKQAFSNSIINYTGILIGAINLLLLQPYFLTPDELGLTRFLISASVIISTVFPLGTNGMIIKFFPKIYQDKNSSNGFLLLMLLICLISYTVFFLGIHFFQPQIIGKYPNSSVMLTDFFYIIYLITLFMGFTNVFTSVLNVNFNSIFSSFMNDIFLRIYMTAMLFLYHYQLISFQNFMILFFLSYFIQTIALFIYSLIIYKPGLTINFNFLKEYELKELLKFGGFVTVGGLASISLRNVDVIIISQKLSFESVAIYSIALFIGNFIEIPSGSLARITDSRISHAFARKDFTEIKDVYQKSCRILTYIGAFLFVLIIININDLLIFLPDK